MRTVQTSLLAGAAMIIFAGFAQAQSPGTHVLTIHLPGGGTEEIRYSGDVPPEIFLEPGPALGDPPSLFPASGPESPFAMLDRISEEMNRRADLLLREAAGMTGRLTADPNQLIEAASRGLPPTGYSYSFVSALSSNGSCSRSVEITSLGDGKQPRVVSHTSGHCGGDRAETARRNAGPPKPGHRPGTIMVKDQMSQPAQASPSKMIEKAAWRY